MTTELMSNWQFVVGGVVVLLLLGLLFMRWMGLLGGKDPVYKGMEYAT